MMVLGTTISLTGAALPAIISAFGLSLAEAGALTGVPSIGFVASVFLGGVLTDRIGIRAILLSGSGLLALALAGFGLAPVFLAALVASIFSALAGGLLESSVNALVARLTGGQAGAALNRLNLFFSLGAFAAPLLIGGLLSAGVSWRLGYFVAAGLVVSFALVAARRRLPAPLPTAAMDRRQFARLLRRRSIALSSLAMFLYVAAEVSLTSWIVTYLERAGDYPTAPATAALSTFWLAMIAGRYLASRLATWLPYRTMVLGGALGGVVFAFAFRLSFAPVVVFGALIGAGLCFAGEFPTILAHASDANRGHPGTVSGIVVAAAGLGALVGPWLLGIVAGVAGLEVAMSLISILMLGVAVAFWRV
jgi:fucose permease